MYVCVCMLMLLVYLCVFSPEQTEIVKFLFPVTRPARSLKAGQKKKKKEPQRGSSAKTKQLRGFSCRERREEGREGKTGQEGGKEKQRQRDGERKVEGWRNVRKKINRERERQGLLCDCV